MDIALYIIIFTMGTVFGSFLTLATYRIPLHKDITHEHSFCPHCNHKLAFLDLIPVWSYLFLRGTCRYCKKKIGIRYFIIEITVGIAFVLIASILQINVYCLTITKFIDFSIACLYIVFIYLVAGIDIRHKTINKGVIIYGFCVACISVLFQYVNTVLDGVNYNLNRIILYLSFIILIIIFNIETIRKNRKYDYMLDLVLILIIMSLCTYEITVILTAIGCLLIIAIKLLINKLFNKRSTEGLKKMPIAFYLVISHIMVFINLYLNSLIR